MAPFNVLFADDDKDDRFFFKKALESITIPCKLATVTNGESLMEYLSKHSEKLPCVLFLDLNMPRKNGNECLVEIKANAKYKDMPVIIYSTSSSERDKQEAHKAGAFYYFNKPNSFADLCAELKIVLQNAGKSGNRWLWYLHWGINSTFSFLLIRGTIPKAVKTPAGYGFSYNQESSVRVQFFSHIRYWSYAQACLYAKNSNCWWW